MKKLADLQGIRGMAISSVLLFHFYPNTFKNGYVGVDQFFVLSGFLMAEILSRDACLSISAIFNFYYRRLKRILPLYVLFIFSTLLFTLLVFPFSTFLYNIPHAVRGLTFMSNTKLEDETQTYERMLSDAAVLYSHTWSLSCEVQFYVVVPFLLVKPVFITRKIVTGFICIASYFFFTYLWKIGMQQFAFYFMLTRIWQFSIGILCSLFLQRNNHSEDYELLIPENEDENLHSQKDSWVHSCFSNITCFSLLLICWFPVEINPHLVRLLVCCKTASLICSGQIFANPILSNRIAVYLGDISYSLYLIHWPIYVYSKQNHFDTHVGSLVGIFCSLSLAAFTYETYEKFYLQLEKTGIVILTLSMYILSAMLIVAYAPIEFFENSVAAGHDQFFKVPENLTVEIATKINRQFSTVDMTLMNMAECSYTATTPDEKAPWEMCEFNNTYFTGDKRILLIGNSYAPNIARMFIHLKECQKKAKQIQMYTGIFCEVLEDSSRTWTEYCKNKTEKFQQIVEKIKPDILFITTLQVTSMFPSERPTDSIFEKQRERLKRMEQNVREKVYILNAFPRPVKPDLTNRINNILITGNTTSQESLIDKAFDFTLARNRMALLAKECTKCELIDIMPTFMKNGDFQLYNEENGIAYFVDLLHLSAYGLQKISNVYRNVCNNI